MKKIAFYTVGVLFCATTLCACSKIESDANRDNSFVSVSFVSEANEAQSKAFFDPSATTEAWEKSLGSLSVVVFSSGGDLILRRDFTHEELNARKAMFAVPSSVSGAACEFYAVANKPIIGITNKAALLAAIESAATEYNGTFAEVTTKAKRATGFVMSGSVSKTIAPSGSATDVSISLKRVVAKIAVQACLSSDFTSKYNGSVKITSAVLSKAASQTTLVGSSVSTGTMQYSHTQNVSEASGKYNSLFYIFENGALAAGGRVLVTLSGVYDKDGNFSTTLDQFPVSYAFELTGTSNNGQITRNGYYRITATLAGLTGQDINATITVADWEVPVTQNINLGQ